MKTFPIIKRAYLWLLMAAILMAWSAVLFLTNVRYSIDFTGGVNMRLSTNVDAEELQWSLSSALEEASFSDTTIGIQPGTSSTAITIKTNIGDDARITSLIETIQSSLIENAYIQDDSQIIELAITWPSVGAYMQSAAIRALVLGIIFMVIYMLFSFSGIRKYVSPVTLAGVTVITMLFDMFIPAGAYGLLMWINPTIQVDTIFIIAILTTMWYSINDTIIIFDRIRENMQKVDEKSQKNLIYGKVFESSLRQVMRRSLGTSISTLLVIVAMYLVGTWVIQSFAFTIGIGVIAGTFSSIFIAAPLAYLTLWKFSKEQDKL